MTNYYNIGNFFLQEEKLIKVFALCDKSTNPYDFVIPGIPRAFTELYSWPYSYDYPHGFSFLSVSTSNLLDQLRLKIWKIFLLFYAQKNDLPFQLDKVLDADWKQLLDIFDLATNDSTKRIEFSFFRKKTFEDKLFSFFEENNYSEFILLMNDYEGFVKEKCWKNGITNSYTELLLIELILKNVTREFFIIEEEVENKITYYKEGEIKGQAKQDPRYFNNTLQISFFHNVTEPVSLCFGLRYATYVQFHCEYKENFKYEYIIHWAFSQNQLIQNNVGCNDILNSYVNLNLKDILRYSQNFVEFIERNEYNINLTSIIENITLLQPKSFQEVFITGQEISPNEMQRFVMNKNFKSLTNKVKLSNEYFQHCRNLYSLLEKSYYEPDNLYLEDFSISMPLWEISRIQHLNIEKFNRDEFYKLLAEEHEEDFD